MALVGLRAWDDAVFLGGCAYALLVFALWLRRQPVLRLRIGAMLKGAKELLRPAVQDATSGLVEDKLMERKLKDYAAFARCICMVCACWDMAAARVILSHGPRYLTPAQDVVVLLGKVSTAVLAFWPGAATARIMDVHYSFSVVVMAVFVLASNAENTMASLSIGNAMMLFLNIFRRVVATRALPIFPVCNLAFALSATYAMATNNRKMGLVMGQFGAVMCYAALCSLLERGMRSTMQQSLEFQAVQGLYAAACALLRTCCQVVVELDSEGVIVRADSDLACFLLQQGLRNYEGTRLVELLLNEEDQQLFAQRLKEPKMRRVGLAETLPVTMKDGCGNILRLELLWFDYRHVDGQLRYMLGLRDLDKEPENRPPLEEGRRWSKSGELSPRSGSSSSFLETCSGGSTPSSGLEAPYVVVDISRDGLPVLQVSSSFQAQVGRLPLQRHFLRHVKHRATFVVWLTEYFDQDMQVIQCQGSTDGQVPRHFRLVLDLPSGRVSAVCRVARPDPEACEDENGIRLCFSRIRRNGVRRLSSGGGSQDHQSL